MNIDTAFPSNYLKAADIEGGDMVLTISKVVMETVGDDEKPIVYFAEMDKGLVLNKTNANTIKGLTSSPNTDDWVGKRISLFATEVDFQGKQTMALRVRMRPPDAAPESSKKAQPAKSWPAEIVDAILAEFPDKKPVAVIGALNKSNRISASCQVQDALEWYRAYHDAREELGNADEAAAAADA